MHNYISRLRLSRFGDHRIRTEAALVAVAWIDTLRLLYQTPLTHKFRVFSVTDSGVGYRWPTPRSEADPAWDRVVSSRPTI